MNPRYYHTPIQPTTTRARCPVCRQPVYSRAGIHPQCAVKQADPPKGKPIEDEVAPDDASILLDGPIIGDVHVPSAS